MSQFERMDGVLNRFISGLNQNRSLEPLIRQRVFHGWTQIVSNGIKSHTHPYDFKNQVLYISVPSNTWFNELYSQRSQFTAQLNAFLKGCIVVKGIFFHVDETFVPQSGSMPSREISSPPLAAPSSPLLPEKDISDGEAFAEDISRAISDDKLRGVMKKTIVQFWEKGKSKKP